MNLPAEPVTADPVSAYTTLGDAAARGCDVLVTGGGPGSNFCAAAAAAGSRALASKCTTWLPSSSWCAMRSSSPGASA